MTERKSISFLSIQCSFSFILIGVNSLNISEHRHDGVIVFVLDGRIDSEGATALEEALHNRFEAGEYRLILDLAGVALYQQCGPAHAGRGHPHLPRRGGRR